mmetsp:Transcript_30136/g.63462  ORF Transcript_30136/g.63462 Transcript_30136/m.63462 type:complete len:92 (-) Transcript_30136:155-430(-)
MDAETRAWRSRSFLPLLELVHHPFPPLFFTTCMVTGPLARPGGYITQSEARSLDMLMLLAAMKSPKRCFDYSLNFAIQDNEYRKFSTSLVD